MMTPELDQVYEHLKKWLEGALVPLSRKQLEQCFLGCSAGSLHSLLLSTANLVESAASSSDVAAAAAADADAAAEATASVDLTTELVCRLLWVASPEFIVQQGGSLRLRDGRTCQEVYLTHQPEHADLPTLLATTLRAGFVSPTRPVRFSGESEAALRWADRRGCLLMVTTHSPAADLAPVQLSQSGLRAHRLKLADFHSERDLSLQFKQFFQDSSSGASLLVLQCDPRVTNKTQMLHARALCTEHRERMPSVLTGERHVMFLVHMGRTSSGAYFPFSLGFNQSWRHVTVDDIVPAAARAQLDTTVLLTTPVAELFERHLPLCKIILQRYVFCLSRMPGSDRQTADITRQTQATGVLLRDVTTGTMIEDSMRINLVRTFTGTGTDTPVVVARNDALLCASNSYRHALHNTLLEMADETLTQLLEVIGRDNNIELFMNPALCGLWTNLSSDPKILNLSELVPVSTLVSEPSLAMTLSATGHPIPTGRKFVRELPFSWTLIRQLQELYQSFSFEIEEKRFPALAASQFPSQWWSDLNSNRDLLLRYANDLVRELAPVARTESGQRCAHELIRLLLVLAAERDSLSVTSLHTALYTHSSTLQSVCDLSDRFAHDLQPLLAQTFASVDELKTALHRTSLNVLLAEGSQQTGGEFLSNYVMQFHAIVGALETIAVGVPPVEWKQLKAFVQFLNEVRLRCAIPPGLSGVLVPAARQIIAQACSGTAGAAQALLQLWGSHAVCQVCSAKAPTAVWCPDGLRCLTCCDTASAAAADARVNLKSLRRYLGSFVSSQLEALAAEQLEIPFICDVAVGLVAAQQPVSRPLLLSRSVRCILLSRLLSYAESSPQRTAACDAVACAFQASGDLACEACLVYLQDCESRISDSAVDAVFDRVTPVSFLALQRSLPWGSDVDWSIPLEALQTLAMLRRVFVRAGKLLAEGPAAAGPGQNLALILDRLQQLMPPSGVPTVPALLPLKSVLAAAGVDAVVRVLGLATDHHRSLRHPQCVTAAPGGSVSANDVFAVTTSPVYAALRRAVEQVSVAAAEPQAFETCFRSYQTVPARGPLLLLAAQREISERALAADDLAIAPRGTELGRLEVVRTALDVPGDCDLFQVVCRGWPTPAAQSQGCSREVRVREIMTHASAVALGIPHLRALLTQPSKLVRSLLLTMPDIDAALLTASGVKTVWECSMGHSYGVGDCGKPMEVGRCPVCGEAIGGTNHTPVRSVVLDCS
jgi:hypothetical protein